MRLTKKHFIVFAMAYRGLNGSHRTAILGKARGLQQAAGYKVIATLASDRSNHCYFTLGGGNGSECSVVNLGLAEQAGRVGHRMTYRLTPAGYELAEQVMHYLNNMYGF